jgi:polar amino acid transport system substrate-binding protein
MLILNDNHFLWKKWMKIAVTIITLILLVCMNLARAEELLIIGRSEEDSPPYYFGNEGFCVEVINAVSKSLNFKVEYRKRPWARMMLEAKNGNVDAIMPIYKTAEREEFLLFPPSEIAFDLMGMFYRTSLANEHTSSNLMLQTHRVGVIRGFSYGAEIDSMTQLERDFSSDERNMVLRFKAGRFDLGLGNPIVIGHYGRELVIDKDIFFTKPLLLKSPMYLGFSKQGKNATFFALFSEELAAFKQSEAYKELSKKYGMDQF